MLRKTSSLFRRFCAKETQTHAKTSYKPLILYSIGIGVVGGLVGSYYTRRKITQKDGEENNTPPVDNPVEAHPVQEQKEHPIPVLESPVIEQAHEPTQRTQDPEETVFSKIFLSGNLPFEAEELNKTQAVQEKEDFIVFLIPPREDEELLQTIAGMIENLHGLYGRGVQRGVNPHPLKVKYLKIKSVKDLETVGKQFGVQLSTSDDVPIMLVRNRLRKATQVLTLMDLLTDEEKFYKQFIPLRYVGEQNKERFLEVVKNIEDDEVILLRYGGEDEAQREQFKSEFYEWSLAGLGNMSRVDGVFAEDLSWLNVQERPAPGEVWALQKQGNLSFEGQAIPGLPGKYLFYKVPIENSQNSWSAIRKLAGETYYKNNVVPHLELPPNSKPYHLEISVDKNKLSDAQLLGVNETLKGARKLLPDTVRMVLLPKSFEASEGKIISVILKDLQKDNDRFDYLFKNKNRKAVQEILKSKPHVKLNDSFEYVFPEELPFTPEGLASFADMVLKGEVPDQIQSQVLPTYERFSRKITGNTYNSKIIDNGVAQAVFLYSTTCGSCKRFTPLYESMAKQNIEQKLLSFGALTQMNNMNKDLNDPSGQKLFDSTPFFLLYRRDFKTRPFVYRQQFLNEISLREFLSITQQFSFVGEDQVERVARRKLPSLGQLSSDQPGLPN